MIRAIAAAGADCVKFQLYRPDHLLSKNVDREVQEIFREHQLSRGEYLKLEKTGKEAGIEVAASVFDEQLLRWYTTEAQPPFIKLASGDITYRRLFETAGDSERPVVFSTGGATQAEIDRALDWLAGQAPTYLLHCQPAYPTDEANLNLARISKLREELQVFCGFSDHSQSDLAPLVAAEEGAIIWERHVTLDRQQPGPEHSFSLPVEKLKQLINRLENPTDFIPDAPRRIEEMRDENKRFNKSRWSEYREQARRSLAADRTLEPGTALREEKLRELRPAVGLDAATIHSHREDKLTETIGEREVIKTAHLR